MSLERRQHVGEGKGAGRNPLRLPDEGETGGKGPMTDLKEAVAKAAVQAWCEPLGGVHGRARYPQLPKPDILSVTRVCIGGGRAANVIDLTR